MGFGDSDNLDVSDSVPNNAGLLCWHRGCSGVWDWGGHNTAGEGEQSSDGQKTAERLHFWFILVVIEG